MTTLEGRQKQTANGRKAMMAKFSSDDEKRAYYREMAARSVANRFHLTGQEVADLERAYEWISTNPVQSPALAEGLLRPIIARIRERRDDAR